MLIPYIYSPVQSLLGGSVLFDAQNLSQTV